MPNTTPNISSELAGSKVRSGDRVLNLSARLSRRVVDYVASSGGTADASTILGGISKSESVLAMKEPLNYPTRQVLYTISTSSSIEANPMLHPVGLGGGCGGGDGGSPLDF